MGVSVASNAVTACREHSVTEPNGAFMAGWYELKYSTVGLYYFVLKASNGESILAGEQYTNKVSTERAIASVQTNCALDDRYDRKQAANGKYYFNLRAANYQIIGTSQMYTTTVARDAGITSVKNFGKTAIVKEFS